MHLTGHGFENSIVLETDKPCFGEVIHNEDLINKVEKTIN